jgi:hypothetical protein
VAPHAQDDQHRAADNGQTGSIGSTPPPCELSWCAELAATVVSELDVELRHYECRTSQCLIVLRDGDACYATEAVQLLSEPFSCALSDAEILKKCDDSFAAPPPVQCPGSGGVSLGAGTLVVPGQPVQDNGTGGTVGVGGVCAADPEPEVCVARDPAEWQGLRVCSPYPPCESSAHCGLGPRVHRLTLPGVQAR